MEKSERGQSGDDEGGWQDEVGTDNNMGVVTLPMVRGRSGAVRGEGKHKSCRHKTNGHGVVSDGYYAAMLAPSCVVISKGRVGVGVRLICERRRGGLEQGGDAGQILDQTC
ncbi:hypothetical protein GGTG_11570 [Gaeumannomyces tritici R3-111a-1]|uniref:Uncharacterized protein n=1 Tax=Gaeumannomyces tritici (strain R3-111a-1) TaxID=644352 RepID=J3PDJ7_GAET3|nr:hypothetical protein GGTG_11570 [Gaeumannomyces tritici R3-111a-1]EJT70547.1 hypothetical protein GGTG_11570 [Gaeumannomyces tritici R3-111a-1]